MEAAHASLERLLAPLKSKWIRDFVYTPDDRDYLDQLRYSLSNSQKTSLSLSVSTLGGLSANADAFSLNEAYTLSLLPSFSTGNTTVGFELVHHYKSSDPTSQAITPRYIGKSIRDDDAGLLVCIAEHRGMGLTEVSSCVQISPGCREHGLFILDTAEFRAVVNSIADGCNPVALKNALRFSFSSIETRPCPLCGAVASAFCGCDVMLSKKKHPLDYEGDHRNLMSYTGTYEGAASIAVYEQGREIFVSSYMCYCDTDAFVDYDTRDAMGQWAMRNAAQRCDINFLKLVMPGVMFGHECDWSPANVPAHVHGQNASSMKRLTSTANTVDAGRPLSIDSSHDNVAAEPDSSIHPRAEDVDVIDLVDELQAAVGSLPSMGLLNENSSRPHEEAEVPMYHIPDPLNSLSDTAPTTSRSNDVSASSQLQAIVNPEEVQMNLLEHSEPQLSECNTPSKVDKASGDQPEKFSSGQGIPPSAPVVLVASTPVILTAPVQLAPAALSGVPKVYTRDLFSSESRRKAELRKIRNRESAQRSNDKRKMRMEQLMKDIDSASNKKAFLHAKEAKLREENESLKAAVLKHFPH